MLQISTRIILVQASFANWKGRVAPLSIKTITIFRCFFLASILRVFFIIIVYLLKVILIMVTMTLRLDMWSHWCQQSLLSLSLFLLFVNIRINLLLLNHTHWLFPYCVGSPFKFGVNVFKIIRASSTRIERIYSLKFVSRYILINKMIVKFDPITMLLNRHPPGIAILHSYPLLSLDNLFHLPPMLSTQL